MPHKLAVIPHLDELTDEGREVGACNTIFFRYREDGTRVLVGTNTDVVGIRDSFYANVKSPDDCFHNRPGMVIGGGGAARSAVYALRKWMKASDIYLVNRDKAEVDAVISECKARGYGERLIHVATSEQAGELEGPGAVVACVPNFSPKTDSEVAARRVIEVMLKKQHKGAVLEMCYHPTVWTEIAEISMQAGWQVILGTEAMIYQGLAQVSPYDCLMELSVMTSLQSKCWTGKDTDELPVKKVHAVIAAKLGETEVLRRTENA